MISSVLANFRVISSLTTLLLTLQLSACGSEDLLSAISPEISSGSEILANSSAVISGVRKGSVIEDVDPDGDNLLEVSGKLIITDSDDGESAFVARTVNGSYGDLNIDSTGKWDYSADNNQVVIQNLNGNATLTDNLTVSSVDGTNLTVEITIIGVIDSVDNTNTPAQITGNDRRTLTEDNDPDNDNLLETSGILNISDADAGESAFIATTYNGNFGALTINSQGGWNYAAINNQAAIQNLNNGANISDSLVISSLDGTTHTIIITINGVNEVNIPAVISGADSGAVTEDNDPDNDNLLEVSGKLNITDSNPGEAAFIANTIFGNYGNLVINAAGNWSYAANNSQSAIQSLNTGATLYDSLVVRSVDGTTRAIVITISGRDEANTATNINISWLAPAAREDNSPISLSEIAGYKIYYGSAQGQYTGNVAIYNSSTVNHTFQNFSSGTYYFVITTVDTQGRESKNSTELTHTI